MQTNLLISSWSETFLRICAPWRYRNTSIDTPLKWNIGEHHSGPVHTFREAGTHLLISHWSGTLKDITLDLCTFGHVNKYEGRTLDKITPDLCTLETEEHINKYESRALNKITPDLSTPLERQEYTCCYPIEVRTLPRICACIQRHETYWYHVIEVEYWRTSLRTYATWRHSNTSIDNQLKWNIGDHHSEYVHTFREVGVHLLISHWSETSENLENITPNLELVSTSGDMRKYFIDIQLKWNIGSLLLVRTCVHPQIGGGATSDISLKWNSGGKYSGPVHASEDTGAHQ